MGRAMAAIGVVCAFLGVWLAALDAGTSSISYWNLDGTLGAYLLVLAGLGAALLVGTVAGNRRLEPALGAVAATLFGSYLLFPASFAFGQLDRLGAGGWLGVCSVVAVAGVGAVLVPPAWAKPRSATSSPSFGTALAFLGLALVLFSLWLSLDRGGGSYWSLPGTGHSLGAAFLALIALCGIGLGAGWALGEPALDLLGAGAAFVLLGLTLFVPVGSAFNTLGSMHAGAWLAFAGGPMLAAGVVLSRKFPIKHPA